MTKNNTDTFTDIITTKLHPPQIRSNIVHRKRLFDKLHSPAAKLTLVSAPAGFGKSTFVLDYLQQTGNTFSWISLDEADNNIRYFFHYLLASLQIIHPAIGEKLIVGLKGTNAPPAETIVTHLINELHRFKRPVTIVLDDYYLIDDREIHKAISFFLEHLPSTVRLIISTRVDPLLPLHRMRARGELIEVRERDLRFTADETDEFFNRTMHLSLSRDDCEKLANRTEGWIAGLQLAAVSLSDVRDVQQFIASFTGTNRYVLDYLIEEVLKKQTKEVQMFLLQTSILTRFNEHLCNCVTGGMNAKKILEHLERSNLFLIPLDDKREWFRYHHLFSELLQYRLRQLYPGLIEELYHNASVWFEEQQHIDEALNYVLRVKNYERAAYLLENFGVILLSRSELQSIINYTNKIPPELTSQYPKLLVAKAWAQMLTHQTGDLDSIINDVEKLVQKKEDTYSPGEIVFARGHIATIRAFILRLQGRLSESLDSSESILETIPQEQHQIRGLLKFNIGRVYMKQGYIQKAIDILESGLDDNIKAGNYYVVLAILGHTGYLYSVAESLYVGQLKLEEAITTAQKQRIDSLPAAGYIYYQLGRVLYLQNKLENAIKLLERAVELGELGNEPDIVCNSYYLLARIYASQGDKSTAFNIFSKAEKIEQRSIIPVYEADIEIERVALACLLGETEQVKNWMVENDGVELSDFSVIDERRELLRIECMIKDGDFKNALGLIKSLHTIADERERSHTLIQLLMFEAIALYGLKKEKDAFRLLTTGLENAADMGYIRVLLNIGQPLSSLLLIACKQNKLSGKAIQFADLLLGSFSGIIATGEPSIKPKYRQELTEPLTDREQEVLYYISQNYSNKELAAKLFVSVDTIKTHLKHIYGKLAVNSRQEAVQKARDLELL